VARGESAAIFAAPYFLADVSRAMVPAHGSGPMVPGAERSFCKPILRGPIHDLNFTQERVAISIDGATVRRRKASLRHRYKRLLDSFTAPVT